MSIKVNLTGVDAWEGGVILPPGSYYVRVSDAEEGTSSGGDPQIQLQLKAIGGEHDGGEIRDWLVINARTLGKVKQVLTALGLPSDGELDLSAESFVGKACQIVVRNEPYDGKDRARVKAYSASTGSDIPTTAGAAPATSTDLPF